MKKSRMLITLSVILLASLAWAQVPQTINYQGVLKDNSGNIVADGNYDLTFRLYDASAGGTEWWSETHAGVPVTDGIFNVILGSFIDFISTVPKTKFEIPYWLEIAVNDETLSTRIQLTAVPYSLTARSVQGYMNVFPSKGNVGIGTTTPGVKLHIVSPNADGIILTDSSTVTYRATLFNWETMGGQLNLNDATGAIQAIIRGYASPGGVQASFMAGNVGIGTAIPAANLQVVGNWTLGPSGTPPGGFDSWLSANNGILYEGGGAGFTHHFSAYGGGDIARFGISPGVGQAPDSRVVIANSGFVGIGTAAPIGKLHVQSSNSDGIVLTDSSTGWYRATLLNLDTYGGQLNLNDATGAIQARIRGYASPGGVQASFMAGNVGIGTMSPSAKLEVVGVVKADTLQLTTPAERWYAIPGPEFRHAKNWYQNSSAYHVSTSMDGDFWAPVHLPHGSTITGFEVTFTDDDSTNADITLYSVFQGNETATPIASLSTSGFTATNTISNLTLTQAVDNQNYTYMVRAYWVQAKWQYDLLLRNARIRYTVDQPLP